MTSEDIYQIWRPEGSTWRRWVKPVVFAFLSREDLGHEDYAVPEWRAVLECDTAILADLPGDEGIRAGMALARAGYAPVLLYNACPSSGPSESGSRAAVDMSGILAAICGASRELASLNLPAQAPPVFLLDSWRHGVPMGNEPGMWDNRSFVSIADFPSGEYLRGRGISKVIVLGNEIPGDLRQVLLQWQREGVTIARQTVWREWAPVSVTVKPPRFVVAAWEWLWRRLGYQRNLVGGSFGGVVPRGSGS